ncbi:MAG: DUF1553 domain-containing protein [Planctomycetaceae bacterium]|nr:DUF1553 domain-containing protein [Planctomycetaceae bacterium]
MKWVKFHWRCAMLGLAVLNMAMLLQAWEPPAKPRVLPPPTKLTVNFVRDIQPLFRKNCYSCHGLETQEAGLRLDRKKLALQGSDRGSVILAGKSADSRLVQVLVGQDQEIGVMPPDGEGTPLTDAQIALIRGWIDQGAQWPDSADGSNQSKHWAFQAIERPQVPRIAGVSLSNPIDAFVLKELGKHNLTLAPSVGRSRLIRRLYLDLLGLTPPPEEVVKFLQDERDDAYEQLVHRVLKSPHYGERWGRHWLDLARYADSDGYEKDRPRPFAWQYRDWVINAFNADMPYDDFTVAQVAGDMLPKATVQHRVASGFHRNTLHNTEGGTDKEEDRVKKTVDRINTVSTIWLGLTVGCAQCHSHKYDPISQREYYSMYAFFNNIDEADIVAPSLQESQQYEAAKKAYDREQQRLQDTLTAYEKTKLPAAQAAWEKDMAGQEVSWNLLKMIKATAAKGADLMVQADRSILATGKNEQSDLYTVTAEMTAGSLAAIRLEVLPHKTLAKQGPGRAVNGNFVLTTLRATLTEKGQEANPVPLNLVRARADFSQQDWAVALAINMDPKDGWAVSPQIGKRHVAAFELEKPIAVAAGSKLTVVLDQAYTGSGTHNLGHFRISTTALTGPVPLDGLPAPVIEAVAIPVKDRNDEQRKTIGEYFRGIDSEFARLNAAVVAHQKKAPKSEGTKAQVVTERSAARVANIHVRGNFLDKGPQVTAGTLDVLPAIESKSKLPNRLDFAQWLVVDQHPLTARVVVNRVWYRYFGRGLVASIDDFGSQGEQPSHPELLDFLASELQENGWSLKYLHRLIVTSQVYQQSSGVQPELQKMDPENALLARQARRRVEAEIVRDLALSVSGLLDPRVGGPSVRPRQPTEYSSLTYANSAKWATSKGGDQYRRGMYTFFQRTSPYPMLMTFDAPDANACLAQRSASNTPMQALTMWNDVVFFECSQHLGQRIMKEVPASDNPAETRRQRIRHAFMICLARYPTEDELTTVLEFFETQRKACESDSVTRDKIIGSLNPGKELDRNDLAGWILVGRALINLDEFISRE